jgi:alkylhydroperoxidase/carboxymuconolactone decarboxylase family protein YurZ
MPNDTVLILLVFVFYAYMPKIREALNILGAIRDKKGGL